MNYYFHEVITKESINDLVEKITNTEGKNKYLVFYRRRRCYTNVLFV